MGWGMALGLADPDRVSPCVVPTRFCGCPCVFLPVHAGPGVVRQEALPAGRPAGHPECPVPSRAAVPGEGPGPVPTATLCSLGGVQHGRTPAAWHRLPATLQPLGQQLRTPHAALRPRPSAPGEWPRQWAPRVPAEPGHSCPLGVTTQMAEISCLPYWLWLDPCGVRGLWVATWPLREPSLVWSGGRGH